MIISIYIYTVFLMQWQMKSVDGMYNLKRGILSVFLTQKGVLLNTVPATIHRMHSSPEKIKYAGFFRTCFTHL